MAFAKEILMVLVYIQCMSSMVIGSDPEVSSSTDAMLPSSQTDTMLSSSPTDAMLSSSQASETESETSTFKATIPQPTASPTPTPSIVDIAKSYAMEHLTYVIIGGAVLLFIIVFFVWCCCCRPKAQRSKWAEKHEDKTKKERASRQADQTQRAQERKSRREEVKEKYGMTNTVAFSGTPTVCPPGSNTLKRNLLDSNV